MVRAIEVYNEFERIWKETVAAHFEVQSQNMRGGTEENHEETKPE
jgi:hypothetical protein